MDGSAALRLFPSVSSLWSSLCCSSVCFTLSFGPKKNVDVQIFGGDEQAVGGTMSRSCLLMIKAARSPL